MTAAGGSTGGAAGAWGGMALSGGGSDMGGWRDGGGRASEQEALGCGRGCGLRLCCASVLHRRSSYLRQARMGHSLGAGRACAWVTKARGTDGAHGRVHTKKRDA
eukprot:scaffold20394_cov109-Isochrysis_galbana.AAC.3